MRRFTSALGAVTILIVAHPIITSSMVASTVAASAGSHDRMICGRLSC